MPALVIASRVYPTCGKYQVRKSGKPDLRQIPSPEVGQARLPVHPRLSAAQLEKTWMAGTRPAMTAETRCMSAS